MLLACGKAPAWKKFDVQRPHGHVEHRTRNFLTGLGYKAKAAIRKGMIYGLGIYNMKGALVCYTQAVKALMRAGVKLEGDVIIAAVVGEIEKTQWSDEFVGKESVVTALARITS